MFIFWGFVQCAHIQKILSSSDTDGERKKQHVQINLVEMGHQPQKPVVLCFFAILVYAPNHILVFVGREQSAMWY